MSKTLSRIIRRIGYYWTKLHYLLAGRNKEVLNRYYRKSGAKIGENCLICTPFILAPGEGYLLEIGNNVVISTNVSFILHDHSVSRVVNDIADIHGKIKIGDNCFIGAGSIIMYGVELASNTIVAAGSVVTKSFKEGNVIIGGNPGKIIGTWDKFREKILKYGHKGNIDIKKELDEHPETFIRK